MGNEVASEIAAWNARAGVAREVAGELEDLSRALTRVVGSNYLGVECEEGSALYSQLRHLLDHASNSISSHAEAIVRLASTAANAGLALVMADSSGADSIK